MLENIPQVISGYLTKFNQLAVNGETRDAICVDSIHNSSELLHSNDFRTAHRRGQGGCKKPVLNRKIRTTLRNLLTRAYDRDLINVTMMATENKENIKSGQGLLAKPPHFELTPQPCALWIQAGAQLLIQNSLTYAGPVKAPSPVEETSTVLINFPRPFYNPAWNALISADGFINNVMTRILPWKGVDARPEISISLDDPQEEPLPVPSAPSLINNKMSEAEIIDRATYINKVYRVNDNYPQLYPLASAYLRLKIREKYNLELNPDATWLNRFQFSSGSSETFTGWEHNSQPRESTSLTEALMANFGAEDQLNSDALSGNSGIYTQGKEASSFGKNNEVRLLPKDFLNLVKESNFSERYVAALENFWKINGSDFRTVCKGKFIALLGEKSNALSDAGLQSVMMAALGDLSALPVMSMEELERKVSHRNGTRVTTFSIYGYHASDIILINGLNNKVILYRPSDDNSFKEFNNHQELNNWVVDMAKEDSSRKELASHFSLYDRQTGQTYAGVNEALKGIGSGKWGRKYINYKSQPIKGDIFSWLAEQAESRTLKDAGTLTTTNDEVFKQQILLNLKPAANMAGLSTLVLPGLGSLILLEIGITQAEIGTFAALNGDTALQRRIGISAIVDGGVNSLFGGLGVADTLLKTEFEPGKEGKFGNEISKANEVPQAAQHVAPLNGRPANFFTRLLNKIVEHEHGLTAIRLHSPENGAAVSTAIDEMGEVLAKAQLRVDTPRGREIVSKYLGYNKVAELTAEDIKDVKENLQSLQGAQLSLKHDEMILQTVSMYVKSEKNTVAYYTPAKNRISLTPAFFARDEPNRLRILIHECMHMSVKEGRESVPDYFYITEFHGPGGITEARDELLTLSAGYMSLDYLKGPDAVLVQKSFMKKMRAKTVSSALISFQYNTVLRRNLLLKNPDSQAGMAMELGDKIPNTSNSDGSLRVPYRISYPRKEYRK